MPISAPKPNSPPSVKRVEAFRLYDALAQAIGDAGANTPVVLHNRSATEPAFLFLADEAPLHRKLGVYEVRG